MSLLRAVAYEASRRRDFLDLLQEVWGNRIPDEEFDWWFERNPAGRLISLAEEDGRVRGVAAMSFARMLLDGQEEAVPFAVHLATHPASRGKGIFTALERRNEQEAAAAGAPIALSFTNRVATALMLGRLGWENVRRLRLWARVLRPVAAVRGFSGRAHADGGLPPAGPRERSFGAIRVERVDRFGPEADEISRRAAPGYGNHVIRDQAYLNWRYATSTRAYRCFEAFRDGSPVGLAVVGHKVHRGVSAGFVADLVASPGAARALLRRCAEELRGGADVIVTLPPAALRRAFLFSGYLPTHMTIRLIGKRLRLEGDRPLGARDWYFSLGDTDFF